MVQRGEHFFFALKTREPSVVSRERRRQDLDGDLALQLRIGRPKCLLHVKVALVVECLGNDTEDVLQHSAPNPFLKTPMAGLVRRVAVWQLRPWGAGPQDPQDAIEHCASVPATAFLMSPSKRNARSRSPSPADDML